MVDEEFTVQQDNGVYWLHRILHGIDMGGWMLTETSAKNLLNSLNEAMKEEA